eukprot:2494440-Rhodomonas_salina.1
MRPLGARCGVLVQRERDSPQPEPQPSRYARPTCLRTHVRRFPVLTWRMLLLGTGAVDIAGSS